MGDNDLTAFPPHIEKFVHLEVVSGMKPALMIASNSSYLTHQCTLKRDHTQTLKRTRAWVIFAREEFRSFYKAGWTLLGGMISCMHCLSDI